MVHAHSSNMHTKIVECVPNFSEGQDQGVIDKITKAIKSTPGVTLLGADPGWSPNRTVYTFVGSPEAVVLGALNGARVAYKYIDMTKHKGEHPRLGALDVCPFTPVRGADMEDCVSCARKFGEKLSEELNVPVYLYGFAAHHDYRRIAPQIRSGEYEGLSEKILKPEWKPDYGPAEFVPRWGATMSGAHVYLIAYNINLLSTKEQAHRIALDIREKGRGKDKPGLLKKIQAKGWWLEESNIAQVSVNVVDNDITPIHVVFEEVLRIANSLKLPVTGSEIVGVVPLKAILEAAEFYMKRDNLFVLEEDQKVRLAIHRLGLNSLSPFDPAQRIIEYMLPDDRLGPQAERTLAQFIHPVRARTPTPGGGSVDAAVASLGAALGAMVSKMTHGQRQWERYDDKFRQLIPIMYHAMDELLSMVDADTGAFQEDMAAHTLPEKTPEEEEAREATVQASLKRAIAVHLGVARSVSKLWELATTTSIDARADLQVLKEIEQCCDDSRQ
ncbi:formimidoyltransferase-cyclodeaminase-like isoform X2 [Haemaphysalis longicornis]